MLNRISAPTIIVLEITNIVHLGYFLAKIEIYCFLKTVTTRRIIDTIILKGLYSKIGYKFQDGNRKLPLERKNNRHNLKIMKSKDVINKKAEAEVYYFHM